MKRALTFLVLLVTLAACAPPPITVIPAGTLAALTLAAMPRTEVPTPIPTATVTEIPVEQAATQGPGIAARTAPGSDCIPASTERNRGLVTRVLDGESIEVVIGNNTFLVRYIGLDAPGIVPAIEWQGPQAISANDRMVSGQFVTLVRDVSDADANGFLLRYVVLNNLFVNYELILQGFARVASTQPDTACDINFLKAQGEAQVAMRGVWVPTPIPSATITLTPTITPVPTATLVKVCECNAPGLSCNSFATQSAAQACFDYCVKLDKDYDRLDKNHNGKACEGLGD
jgi:micrococcal nuclease